MASLSREEVHEALEALNDNVRLAHATLATRFQEVERLRSVDDRANRMRAILLDAIEVLRPPRRMPFGSLESRHYDVLSLRYVSGMSVNQISGELAVGSRQIHRDLLEAELKLVDILTSVSGPSPVHPPETSAEPIAGPPDQLEPVNLTNVVRDSVALLGPLAARFCVSVAVAGGDSGVFVTGEYARLKQVMAQCLSAAIQSAAGGSVMVDVTPDDASACITIRYVPTGAPVLEKLAAAQRVAEAQDIACSLRLATQAQQELTLVVPRSRVLRVLVVEDNESAVALYRRYLPSEGCELHATSDPRLSYEAAKRLRPDVIVLDIMMPKMDGWSVLALLSQHPDTKDIPVLICSVVDDAELARALGARACLKKPVSQAQFLAALRHCLRSAPSEKDPALLR